MIASLWLLVLIIVASLIHKYCFLSPKRIEFNHIFSFSLGYLFYCIIPSIFFELIKNIQNIAFSKLSNIYKAIPDLKLMSYLIISFLYYISFTFGASSAKKLRFITGYPRLFHDRYFNFNIIQNIVFLPVFMLGILLIYLCRTSFFVGYTGEKLASSSLSAYEFLLNAFVLMYLNSFEYKYHSKSLILNKWVLWLIIYSILLLTTGGRLYVMTCFMSVLIFYSCIKLKGLNTKYTIITGIIVIALVGIIGILRAGSTVVNFTGITTNILGESLLTSWSGISYIRYYSLFNLGNIFEFGKILFTGLLNVVPTFIFSEKGKYMYSVWNLYPLAEAPGGATHFFLTYNGGLGIVLSVLFFFVLGRLLGRMHKNLRIKNVAVKTIYCLVSANLLFTLYRDAFSISVIKNIFELSIVVPYFIIWSGGKISRKPVRPDRA